MSATTSKSASVPDESSATVDASHASNTVPPQPASRSNAAGQRTPPKTGSVTVGSASSPRKLNRPGISAAAHTNQSVREDDRVQHQKWAKMGQEKFIGLVSVDQFLESMPSSGNGEPRKIAAIVKAAGGALEDAKKHLKEAKNEDQTSKPLVEYLRIVVKGFPEGNRPYVDDTHHTQFKAVIEIEHLTMPDVTFGRPGVWEDNILSFGWRWLFAGLVIELKFKVDIFDADGKLKKTKEAEKAIRQIMKSARNLLMTHHGCHVYVVAVFDRSMTRIFRFDRGGFIATQAFDWLTEQESFVTFFYRLYNSKPGRMVGDDDTVSIPSLDVKKKIFKRIQTLYPKMTFRDATQDSLRMKAVLFDEAAEADRESNSKVVNCLTFGPPLSIVDSLFGRATHVYTVILESDLDETVNPPAVRALKDSWRQAIRRPELDFYDAIEYHCLNAEPPVKMEGMARCRGSVDLFESKKSSNNWDRNLHRTLPLELENSVRHHMRTLLTPVGTPLNKFSSPKVLVKALRTVVLQLITAYEAGVLHRDVSEGNVLLLEALPTKGFILDWDYAQFTPAGLEAFHKAFPGQKEESKRYEAVEKSLKDITVRARSSFPTELTHGLHHDLESVFWLLIWMILRHTDHRHKKGALACVKLFDGETDSKDGWLARPQLTRTGPLFRLAEDLRKQLRAQYDSRDPDSADAPLVNLTADKFSAAFDQCLKAQWKPDDLQAAIPYRIPDEDPENNQTNPKVSHVFKLNLDNRWSLPSNIQSAAKQGTKGRSAVAQGSKAGSAASTGSKRGRPTDNESPPDPTATGLKPRQTKKAKRSEVAVDDAEEMKHGVEEEEMEVDPQPAPARVTRSATAKKSADAQGKTDAKVSAGGNKQTVKRNSKGR
ncbi:Pkinase-fungal domain-containing protein [Favolaschia claudopus]|uniref:Pkinase-fungal domain-containing protein n=1 Tax=Favolaschia claudopus TaxID=2862362 RepID=A0AAW0D9J1_9AGAR